MQNIEVREIPLSLKHLRLRHRSLLEKHGLTMEDEPDFLCGIFDCDDNLLGAASLCGNIIKGVVVDEALRGTDAAAMLLTAVRDKGLAAGHTNLFLFTKPEYRDMFASMAFHPVGEGRGAVLLESNRRGISAYCQYLGSLPRKGERNGAIVMNVNPFTRGHRYLIEQAAAGVDTLFIIPVGENEKTRFSYAERLEMLRRGTADIPNVVIADASPYSISAGTFPSYFIKSVTERTDAHITLDLDIFCRHIAPALHISERFAGTEPADPLTARYNSLMQEILPARGIKFTEIERCGDASGIYSASRVRTLLDEGMTARAASLLPSTSLPVVLAHIACAALKGELELTPKPGLVDRCNSGAHRDMDFRLMARSIEALRPGFAEIARLSMREELPCGSLLSPVGVQAEQEMLKATGGVNTHRGALFSMGLAVSAAAWLMHSGKMADRNDICRCIAEIAKSFPRPKDTHGHAVRHQYSIPTALDEACSGFAATVKCCDEPDLHRRLLLIITSIADSNLYYRGGKEGADYARTQALNLLENDITPEALRDLDRDFTERNLSPGGAADMLALTIFLNHFKPNNKI